MPIRDHSNPACATVVEKQQWHVERLALGHPDVEHRDVDRWTSSSSKVDGLETIKAVRRAR